MMLLMYKMSWLFTPQSALGPLSPRLREVEEGDLAEAGGYEGPTVTHNNQVSF